MLYESMTEISNAKNMEDKFQVENQKKDRLITTLNDEKDYLQAKLTESNKDRDETRADNKEMADNKNK
jgi:hypothetical protein